MGAALLAITLVPVLMGYMIRGKVMPEAKNPINRLLIWVYHPIIKIVLKTKIFVVLLAIGALAAAWVPYQRMGSEFMPPLNEGDLLYMPTTLPGISITKAKELLQQTDKIIKSFPEVNDVTGKVGRAETATDPAPLSMLETTITLKPKDQWREGTASVYAERVTGGNFLDFQIKRNEAARYGLTVGDVQDVIMTAIGGMNI